jgi:hypothetical protein
MEARQHSTLREGVVTGIIGAVIVAVWYFIVDLAAGQPLHTPNVLGKIFLRGDLTPGTARIVPQAVVLYTLIHLVLFGLVGVALTWLTHLASRSPALRMGVWIGLLVAFGLFAGETYSLAVASGERFSPWLVIAGSLLGVLGMAGFLWRRHPQLVRSIRDLPLGSEVPPPPHPPERPRAA